MVVVGPKRLPGALQLMLQMWFGSTIGEHAHYLR
jgi:hypothetical protein